MAWSAVVIELREVSRAYGDVVAVRNVSLTAGPGVVTLVGHNGAGKSTVLRLLCGIDRATTGRVRVLGSDPAERSVRRRVGCALGDGLPFGDLLPLEYVQLVTGGALGRRARGAAVDALDAVGIGSSTRTAPTIGQRSAGERQRIRLAAAIAHRPQVLLLDEPLAGLDERWRSEIVALLAGLAADGCCVVATAHDHRELAVARPRVVTLRAGEVVPGGAASVAVRSTDPTALAGALVTAGVARSVDVRSDDLVLVHTDDADGLGRVMARVADAVGCRIQSVTPRALEAGR